MGEVSRYLVAVEGMHIEEPLRLRLMSHLHAVSASGSENGGYLVPVTGVSFHSGDKRGPGDKLLYSGPVHSSGVRACYDRSLSCYRPWGDSPGTAPGGLY